MRNNQKVIVTAGPLKGSKGHVMVLRGTRTSTVVKVQINGDYYDMAVKNLKKV